MEYILISVLVLMYLVLGAFTLFLLFIAYVALFGDFIERNMQIKEYQKRLKEKS